MVLHSVRLAGYDVTYAGSATVHEYDIILVSITSDCDWWPFVAERSKWKQGKYIVIAGGAGVLNVRPFLSVVDCFVLGRGEKLINEILSEHESGSRLKSPSVIWSDCFDPDSKYEICQTDKPYPHTFNLTNGKPFTEGSIGCPNKCFFCGYTWHRKYIGDGTYKAGAEAMTSVNRERTIIDLLKLPPDQWQDEGPLRIVGLDGMSERLRKKANKIITREMLRDFFTGLTKIAKPHQIKVYCIVGYPEETQADWFEFCEDLKIVDSVLEKHDKQWSLLVHFTPFRPMPGTPAACWPMSQINYRGLIARTLKNKSSPGNVFYQGNQFWAVEGMGTDGLSSVIQSAIALRGTESDTENIIRIANAHKYWRASGKDKVATLKNLFDIDNLFSRFTWLSLPTKYLPVRKY